MGFFITSRNDYYEGDRAHQLDVDVPQRPDFTYDWDGAQWVFNPAKVPPLPKDLLDSFNVLTPERKALFKDEVKKP